MPQRHGLQLQVQFIGLPLSLGEQVGNHRLPMPQETTRTIALTDRNAYFVAHGLNQQAVTNAASYSRSGYRILGVQNFLAETSAGEREQHSFSIPFGFELLR